MTQRRMLSRTMRYYWSTGLFSALGLAVAAAVITGSLVIGDSVRGSIRETALSRLGRIEVALQSPHFLSLDTVKSLRRHSVVSATVQDITPLILTTGSVLRQEDQQLVPRVTVIGVPRAFWALYDAPASPPLGGQSAAVNAALAEDLGLKTGDSVLLNAQRQSAMAGDTLFAGRKRDDALAGVLVDIGAIVPGGGVGDFRLDAQTAVPRNLFVDRDWLAEQLGQAGRANAIVVGGSVGPRQTAESLSAALAEVTTLGDLGLAVRPDRHLRAVTLSSAGMTLTEAQVGAAHKPLQDAGQGPPLLSSVYLATRIKVAGTAPDTRETAYAMVAGVGHHGHGARQGLSRPRGEEGGLSRPREEEGAWRGSPEPRTAAGLPQATPAAGTVWLNEWAAADLRARVGDRLELTYLVPTDDGTYPEAHLDLKLTRIVPDGWGLASRDLLPMVPGVTDAATIDTWDAPFPVDMKRITDRDEVYWQRYRGTPKAFVSLETARALWRSAPDQPQADWVTGVHVFARAGEDLDALAEAFTQAIRAGLEGEPRALAFLPVRETALKASRGTSDFGQLFLGLSMFIVASGLALSGMLLRLSLERRSGQVGLLLACGWTTRQVGRLLFAEGLALAVVGTILGVPAGVAYARLLIAALTSQWSGALGMTSRLWLHVTPASLSSGAVAGLALGVLVTLWSIRRLVSRRPLELLAGWQASAAMPHRHAHRRGLYVMLGGVVKAAALVGGAIWIAEAPPTIAFFGAGVYLLVAGLAGARWLLGHTLHRHGATRSLGRFAARNAAAQPGRSLLVIGLLASATFVLVAVATNARDLSRLDPTRKDSGTGGFTLRAVSSVPLPYDPSSPAGRRNLGFTPEDEAALAGVEIMPFLSSPGEDISCLNLSRPSRPRLLGVSPRMVTRGGFPVKTQAKPAPANPWMLLEAPPMQGLFDPLFGDASSVQWTLHSGLGRDYGLQTPEGPVFLKFTGLLQGSVFQGELLASEAAFRRLYPAITRPAYFLIATPAGREQDVSAILRRNLGDYGVEVRSTSEILQAFLGVQNAYLAMFLALGGVGLMLGTVGLAVVILRSALERRGQFALLIATGLRPRKLGRLLLMEHAGLLGVALLGGTAAALVAVAPQLASSTAAVNWIALLVVLCGIVVTGMATCWAAVRVVLRGGLVQALRAE